MPVSSPFTIPPLLNFLKTIKAMSRNFYLLFLSGLPLVSLALWTTEPVPPADRQTSGPATPTQLTAYRAQEAGGQVTAGTAQGIPPGQGESPYSTDKQVIARGEALFQNTCASCHHFGQRSGGPDLTGVTRAVSATWLTRFIRDAPGMIMSGDARGRQLMTEYSEYMPPFRGLSNTDIRAILSYIHTQRPQTGAIASAFGPPVADPIPARIGKAGLRLNLKLVATAPSTSSQKPRTRVNQMRVVTVGTTNRHFLVELRGTIYEMVSNKLKVYMDFRKQRPKFIDTPGHGTGLGGLAFHPQFATNGLFYTAHSEPANTLPADFSYDGALPVAFQWVVLEWKVANSAATTFAGTSREIMRVNMMTRIHGIQELNFNPSAQPGSPEHGLLYLTMGEGGMAEQGYYQLCNSNKTIWGSVLRIHPDPAYSNGQISINGKYSIPGINPYALDADPSTLGEIYARGFRNPNRFTWGPDGKLLIADIGLKNIEEVNIGQAGADYGWPAREGTFQVNYQNPADMHQVYPLAADDAAYNFTYPVCQYDSKDEGDGISGGVLYNLSKTSTPDWRYIFGDIVNGRVFCVPYNDLQPGQQARIEEMDLVIDGRLNTFLKTTAYEKADLRFGFGPGQKLYLFTKTDGKIYEVTGVTSQ
jgi:glucose/arabinose dehydrogenase